MRHALHSLTLYHPFPFPFVRMARLRLKVYEAATRTPSNDIEVQWATSDGAPTAPLFSSLQALVHVHTGLEPRNQHLLYGEASYPIQDDADVQALLLRAGDPDAASSPSTSASPHAFISVLPANLLRTSVQDGCSRIYFGERAVLQPCYVIPGSDQGVCEGCQALCFPEGLLLSKVGAPMEPFVCGAPALCAEGLGAYLFEERLHEAKAICGGEGEKEGEESNIQIQAEESTARKASALSPPALALLATFRQAAYAQQALGFDQRSREAAEMMGRLQSGRSTRMAYEATGLKNKALATIPLAALHARAMAAGGDPQRNPLHFQDALLRELLAWFKHEFFVWVNNPPCERCGGTDTTLVGGAAPTPAESAGKAGRVEVYKCKGCPAQTRFPRYNDPGVLLDTRRGRCGEWANCFTLCCVALGFEARYICDWTDHVFTEIWSPLEGRYIHLDSCENAADTPLMYEGGWGKKLSYVVAFGKDHCVDVTRRYTRTFETDLLSRRQSVPELVLAQQLAALNQQMRGGASTHQQLQERARREQFELHSHTVLGEAGGSAHLKPGELRGRSSGNAAWKRARGEDGLGAPGRELECGGSETCASLLEATCAVPPALVEGEANEPGTKTVVVEREEMAELSLWPYVAGGRSLLMSATSIGSLRGESLTQLGSYGGFGPEAITINGLPVAVGRRGLNVVVLDLARLVIEQSVAFDADDADDDPAGNAAVAFLRDKLAQGKVVVAVVLGSGAHALCQMGADFWNGALGSPPKTPGRSEPWLVITGGKTAAWTTAETRAAGQGPVKTIVTLPLPTNYLLSASSSAGSNTKVWQDAIAAMPVAHSMGPQGDGVLSTPPMEAYQAMRAAFPHAPLAGFSYKPGSGLVGMARTSGLRGGAGWTTHLVSSLTSVPALEEEDVKVRIHKAFSALVAQGMAPNVAALQALSQIKEQQEQQQQRQQQEQANNSSFAVVYGPLVGASARPPLSETVHVFDDFEVATPAQAMAEWQESFPLLRLQRVRVWTSARGVLGLQAGYDLWGSTDAPIQWAPVHHPSAKSPSPASFSEPATGTLVLGPEEGLAMLGIQTSDTGVLGLSFTTTTQRKVSFGLPASSSAASTSLAVPPGMEVVAFHGTLARDGLQRLGMITKRQDSKAAGIISLPADAWGIYTACPVDRATRQLLHWSGGEKGKVLAALRAARRYLENCLKDPSNTTYRLIRVRSKFFLENVGALPGSGGLMQALGFEHVAAVAAAAATMTTEGKEPEEEACYMLPLARVAPSSLQHSVGRLDINIARLVAETGSSTGV